MSFCLMVLGDCFGIWDLDCKWDYHGTIMESLGMVVVAYEAMRFVWEWGMGIIRLTLGSQSQSRDCE